MEDFLLNWKPSAETFIAGSSDREKKVYRQKKAIGKYLFFTRWSLDNDEDVFRVSAKINDRLRDRLL